MKPHNYKWTDEAIRQGISMVMMALGINRMPTRAETVQVTGNTALRHAIAIRGGFTVWADKLGLAIETTKAARCVDCGKDMVTAINNTRPVRCAECKKEYRRKWQKERYAVMSKPMDSTTLMLLVADVERGRTLERAAQGLPWSIKEIRAFAEQQRANGNWDKMRTKLRRHWASREATY